MFRRFVIYCAAAGCLIWMSVARSEWRGRFVIYCAAAGCVIAVAKLSKHLSWENKLVKPFVICFAAAGCLLTAWVFGALEFLGIGHPPGGGWQDSFIFYKAFLLYFPSLRHPLLLLLPYNAVVYAAFGYVLGRALRRLPDAAQDPRGHGMVRWVVVCFALAGEAIAVWYQMYLFFPLDGQLEIIGRFLFFSCASCFYDEGLHGWVEAIASWGPPNALFMGLVGWAVGRAFRRLPPKTAAASHL
jgi:hypothetical protein